MEGPWVPSTSGGGCHVSQPLRLSRHHSLPWGLWRVTNGPLMITSPVRIPMEGRLVSGTSGGGCHVKRATLALDITAFPGDSGE